MFDQIKSINQLLFCLNFCFQSICKQVKVKKSSWKVFRHLLSVCVGECVGVFSWKKLKIEKAINLENRKNSYLHLNACFYFCFSFSILESKRKKKKGRKRKENELTLFDVQLNFANGKRLQFVRIVFQVNVIRQCRLIAQQDDGLCVCRLICINMRQR